MTTKIDRLFLFCAITFCVLPMARTLLGGERNRVILEMTGLSSSSSNGEIGHAFLGGTFLSCGKRSKKTLSAT